MPESGPDIAKTLASVPLFADLKKRQLGSLAKVTKQVVHGAGREVATQGRAGLAFHIVVEGSATVRVGDVVRRVLQPGEFFGEISMIDGQPRSASVAAGENGMITYAINRADFLSLVDHDPEFARAIMVALCGQIRAATQAR